EITEIVPTICEEFEIIHSADSPGTSTMIPFDSATCEDCLAEINDPADRRFGYPFTNCTNCGPRYTIIKHIPYDRPFTSMHEFVMCEKCQAEYDDPGNRRFHAQPNACPECGPEVWIDGIESENPVSKTVELLREGKIGAIKGIGGFHLAVDANNEAAVARLRQRKNREAKPLAMMVPDLEYAKKMAVVTPSDELLLTALQRPIVLLPEINGPERVGLMLPYTPLHHLLLTEFGGPLVMTSGNLSDEPIAISNEDAKTRLSDIADFMLLHNRDIVTRCDDSVVL
ncbi:MAG: carbamoyltransferase HypF, partial [bacterium]|nr:carbamoyltransferase HypF [bacterium]